MIDDIDAAFEIIASSPGRWKLLIVNVDHAEGVLDIEDIVRNLIVFRGEYSSCVMALLSYGFASDDGSLIRSTIADCSFRATVSTERIIAALPDVYEARVITFRKQQHPTISWIKGFMNVTNALIDLTKTAQRSLKGLCSRFTIIAELPSPKPLMVRQLVGGKYDRVPQPRQYFPPTF